MTRSENARDAQIRRAAESLKRHGHAEREGSVPAGLARELADARRQIAVLRRENAALQARLELEGDERRAAAGEGPLPYRLGPRVGIGGRRRG